MIELFYLHIDGILTSTTTPCQSGTERNCNDRYSTFPKFLVFHHQMQFIGY